MHQAVRAKGYVDKANNELSKSATLLAPRGTIYDIDGIASCRKYCRDCSRASCVCIRGAASNCEEVGANSSKCEARFCGECNCCCVASC